MPPAVLCRILRANPEPGHDLGNVPPSRRVCAARGRVQPLAMESQSSGGKPRLQPGNTESAKAQPADTRLSSGKSVGSAVPNFA
jgi:hypothetical protein